MKRLLVTGASGFLGWNLCRIASRQWHVTGIRFSTLCQAPKVKMIAVDLCDRHSAKRLFDTVRPDALIHAAAAATPGYCQKHPADTYRTNVEASVTLATLCAQYQIPCVFTSTDLVFDGLNPPYSETDPLSPTSVYGRQKVLAEQRMTAYYPDTTICRMALMFGAAPPGAGNFLQTILTAIPPKKRHPSVYRRIPDPTQCRRRGKRSASGASTIRVRFSIWAAMSGFQDTRSDTWWPESLKPIATI